MTTRGKAHVSRFHRHVCAACNSKTLDCNDDHRYTPVEHSDLVCANPRCERYCQRAAALVTRAAAR